MGSHRPFANSGQASPILLQKYVLVFTFLKDIITIMIETKKHVYLNGKYLQDAKALLDKQDYVQASEKLWGAVAQIIKAIALNRGKRLRTHTAINTYIVQLAKELNDASLLDAFSIANSLHQNFYENWLAPETVIQNAKTIERLINKLRPLAT